MIFRISDVSSASLYRQIAEQVRRGIASGELLAGERLPAARDLADSLQVNMHTVRQAYNELQRDGLIDLRPGRGATVRTAAHTERVAELARELMTEARRAGLTIADIHTLLEDYQ